MRKIIKPVLGLMFSGSTFHIRRSIFRPRWRNPKQFALNIVLAKEVMTFTNQIGVNKISIPEAQAAVLLRNVTKYETRTATLVQILDLRLGCRSLAYATGHKHRILSERPFA